MAKIEIVELEGGRYEVHIDGRTMTNVVDRKRAEAMKESLERKTYQDLRNYCAGYYQEHIPESMTDAKQKMMVYLNDKFYETSLYLLRWNSFDGMVVVGGMPPFEVYADAMALGGWMACHAIVEASDEDEAWSRLENHIYDVERVACDLIKKGYKPKPVNAA